MKHLKSWVATSLVVAAASAFLIACGLAGCGGSNQSTTTPINGLSTPHIEAIVLVSPSNLKNPTEFTSAQLMDPTNAAVKADLIVPSVFGFQDLSNLQTGEDYVFQLVAYGTPSSGNPYGRVILPATFGTSDTTGVYGTLADNSGVFLASNNATTAPVSIYASYNGQSYSSVYQIQPRQARVIGQVQLQTSNAAVAGTTLDFYDVNGNLTGTVTTAIDGTYRASLPAASATITVDPHSLALSIYGLFVINGTIYTAGDPGCRALLPTLTVGTQTMSTISLIPTSVTPAPSANGCTGG